MYGKNLVQNSVDRRRTRHFIFDFDVIFQKIDALCWNESTMLPHFLDYYKQADQIRPLV